MGAASCHRDIGPHRNRPSKSSTPRSGLARNCRRNTDRVDREAQCNATFRALNKAGISFTKIDITQDPEARDYVMALGYLFSLGFATVSMADQRIVGAPDAARCACGVRSPPPVVEVIQ
jgi:glutaredoxin